MAKRWTVTLPEERRAARAVVVEADGLVLTGGALMFTRDDGSLVIGYGLGAWATVVEGGPGDAPEGAQVFSRG